MSLRQLAKHNTTCRYWEDQKSEFPRIVSYLQYKGRAQDLSSVLRLAADKLINEVLEEIEQEKEKKV